MFKKLVIIGLGLLGGSIAKCIKGQNQDVVIEAYGRDKERLSHAMDDNSVDVTGSLDEIKLGGVDLIVVATPVAASVEIISDIMNRPDLDTDTIIIDVGSIKDAILREITGFKNASQFIGCHPMAGSENNSYSYSSGELFNGASIIITPHKFNSDEHVQKIIKFWEMLGGIPVIVSSELHDYYVAFTSHLPHIISCHTAGALKDFLVNRNNSDNIKSFIGKGFLDVTRLSSGSPVMWRDITVMNRDNISESLSLLIDGLKEFKKTVDSSKPDDEKILNFYKDIKLFRDGIK